MYIYKPLKTLLFLIMRYLVDYLNSLHFRDANSAISLVDSFYL